jgi:hypothetical protein
MKIQNTTNDHHQLSVSIDASRGEKSFQNRNEKGEKIESKKSIHNS